MPGQTELEETVRAVCFQYSEWLDGYDGLMVPPRDGDERTHEDLVAQFLQERRDGGYLPVLGG